MPTEEMAFWRQTPESTAWPWDVYDSFKRQQPMECALPLPTGVIIVRLRNVFPGCVCSADTLRWASPTNGAIVARWSQWHFHFDLNELVSAEKNRIIDVLAEYCCPLYDPILAEKYGLDGVTVRNTSLDYIYARFDYLYAHGKYVYEPSPEHNWYVCARGLWSEMQSHDREMSHQTGDSS